MVRARIQPKNAWEREMLRQELLIDWRSYPNKDAVLTEEELERWMQRLQECLRLDCGKSRGGSV